MRPQRLPSTVMLALVFAPSLCGQQAPITTVLVDSAWRPERETRGQALSFAGTRVGVVFAGCVAERILMQWRGRERRRQVA